MGEDSQPLDELDRELGVAAFPSSVPHLAGLFVKRTVFDGLPDMIPLVKDVHLIGVHNSPPLQLYVRAGRRVERFYTTPGQVALGPAGYAQEHAWDKRTEDVIIGIPPDSVYLGSSGATLRPIIAVHDPLLAQLQRSLARTFKIGTGASLYADALAHALGAHLVEHYSDRSPPRQARAPNALDRRQLEQVFDFIESKLHQALTVTELAAVAGVSPTHFTRLFRQQTGEPPHRYVRKRRLDEAERLIVGTQMPLAAIAVAVGFSDQSHLNRVMRAQRGATPGQLRSSLL
jgi:AraC family transcriptional regulator